MLLKLEVTKNRLVAFFFFQAEDGIRDVAVTGVQTCALPILEVPEPSDAERRPVPGGRKPLAPFLAKQPEAFQVIVRARADELPPERHFGQEGSSRRSTADGELLPASAAEGRVRQILIGTAGTGHAREEIRKMPERFLEEGDRKSTRLNSSHGYISYAVFCLKKKKKQSRRTPTRRASSFTTLTRASNR